MMREARSLIAELDATLARAPESRRVAILRSVTSLYIGGLQGFSDAHVAVFDDVFGRLIEKASRPTLIEFSARMAPLAPAPRNVIAQLASNDDITISGPLLEKCSELSEENLAEIAATKHQKYLAAIAGRARIDVAVTDVLVDRANSDVVRKMTVNPGAAISELGFVKLIGRAKTDKPLAEAIAGRSDVPPELQPFLRLALET